MPSRTSIKPTCRERCLRYLKKRPGVWVESAHMQRLAAEKRTCTPRTVVRRLQELAEEEVIKVQIVNGNAQYQYIEIPNADGWYKERCMRYMVIRKDTWVPLSKIQEDAAKKGGDPFRVAAAMDELVKEGHLIRRAPDIAWGRTEVSYQYDPWVC